MADPSDNQLQQEVVASIRNYQQPSIAGNMDSSATTEIAAAGPAASYAQPQPYMPAQPVQQPLQQPGYAGQRPAPPMQRQSVPGTVPQTTGAVYEEIQIAPHPTTNRFPWTPVQNPVVEITSTPQPDPTPEPEPVFEVPQPAVVRQPVPVAPLQQTVVSVPETLPEPPPTLEPAPTASVPEPEPLTIAVPAPTIPEPEPIPAVQPEPIPAVAAEPILPPAPVKPVNPAPPRPEPLPVEPPISEPAATHQPAGKPIHIYSQYTREVWGVFKPNNIIRIMLVGAIVTALAVGIFAWLSSGSPTDITRIPFVRSWLQME